MIRTRIALWGAGVLALALPAAAQNTTPQEIVYCTAGNSRILALDFESGTVVGATADAHPLHRLDGVAVRDDVRGVSVLTIDRTTGDVRLYRRGRGRALIVARMRGGPHGLSIGPDGTVYVVTSRQGGSSVWRIPAGGTRPAGYAAPQLVDGANPSTVLGVTLPVTVSGGALQAGDLLVASVTPPAVDRYPTTGTGFAPRVPFISGSALSGAPTGLAFSLTGELLVGTSDGAVLRFDGTGQRIQPDLLTGLGGSVRLSVGIQGADVSAFVGAGGTLQRYRLEPDGSVTPDGALAACGSAAGGVSLGSATATPTPEGQNVEIRPLPELTLTFDDVTRVGLTTARVIEFKDNRAPGTSQPLQAFFPNDPDLRAVLPNVLVPSYVQAFRKRAPGDPAQGPYTGPPTFVLAIIDTTAEFRRTAAIHEEEGARLGYDPACDEVDVTKRPRTFYVPESGTPKGEPPLVEGAVFTDFSTGCGSNIGRGSRFSLWLTGRDTRSTTTIVDDKLASLDDALNFYSSLIDSALFTTLSNDRANAASAWASGDATATQAALAQLIADVDANPSGFTADPANVPGELIARAISASFLTKAVPTSSSVDVMVGDNDGYGFGAGVVPDGGTLPQTSFDNRSSGESAASDGAERTDLMPALPTLIGQTQSFDVLLPFTGTLTSGTFEFDIGGREQSANPFVELRINGVSKGNLSFTDGVGTRIVQVSLDATDLANANGAGQVVATFVQQNQDGDDDFSFDYFRLTGTADVGVGAR